MFNCISTMMRMKTYKHTWWLAALLLMTQSCNFLEVEQVGKSSIKAFYSDIYTLEAAVTGTYSLTYDFYDSYAVLYPEVTGDLIRFQSNTSDWRQIFNYTADESDEATPVGYIWKNAYEIISNANEIIYYGPSIADKYPTQSARVDDFLAQAYFLRALAHLQLCSVYGQTYTYTADASHLGVAVMTYVPDVKQTIARSSVKAVYSQIISDLNKALGMFSSTRSFDVNFASPAAAKALLARVYLYMGDWAKASEHAQQVIDDGSFTLTAREDYVAMFSTRANGSEAILRLNGYDRSTNLQSTFNYLTPKMYPSAKLLQVFSDDASKWRGTDVREQLLNYEADGTTYSGVCMKFYDTEDIAAKEKHYDPFVLRLSEMYLIHAEAEAEQGNASAAVSDIAKLEARARGTEESAISITYSSTDDLINLIERERIKELYLEGHRQYDITRRHETLSRDSSTGSTLTKMEYPDNRFILPIPLVELDANKAMQSNPINSTQQ